MWVCAGEFGGVGVFVFFALVIDGLVFLVGI